MVSSHRWLQLANALLWLPLIMAGGSWVLSSGVAAPKFIALLSIGCLLLSIVLLWVGVVGIMQRPIRMGDLMWLSLFGLGALLYTQLGKLLSPA